MGVFKLSPQIQNYAWGDAGSIAALQGRPAPELPEAEAWFGAHPSAPAGTPAGPLDQVIGMDRVGVLGGGVDNRFGGLPFMVKLLAAARPLSIQAHPSLEQAREGFAREEAAGIPLGAPERNYKDPNHKPEVLIALTEFKAMAGFRDPAVTSAFMAYVGVPELEPVRAILADSSIPESERIRTVLEGWMREDDLGGLAAAVAESAAAFLEELAAAGPDVQQQAFPRAVDMLRNLVEIGRAFPGDPGILPALLLNHVTLQPGDALHLPAGNLHAYLSGFGVEVMANSDNVLRGGLTPKHVDVDELLSILEFTPLDDPTVPASVTEVDGFRRSLIDVHAPDFLITHLHTIDPTGGSTQLPGGQPTIVLNVAGTLTLGGAVVLGPGEAAFISADEGPVAAVSESADFFVVTPGEL